MIMEIGITAGEIWGYLEENGPEVELENLVEDLYGPEAMILMSVGWLAREGHISVSLKKDQYYLRLIRLEQTID